VTVSATLGGDLMSVVPTRSARHRRKIQYLAALVIGGCLALLAPRLVEAKVAHATNYCTHYSVHYTQQAQGSSACVEFNNLVFGPSGYNTSGIAYRDANTLTLQVARATLQIAYSTESGWHQVYASNINEFSSGGGAAYAYCRLPNTNEGQWVVGYCETDWHT
jgi:hypothetical protein